MCAWVCVYVLEVEIQVVTRGQFLREHLVLAAVQGFCFQAPHVTTLPFVYNTHESHQRSLSQSLYLGGLPSTSGRCLGGI